VTLPQHSTERKEVDIKMDGMSDASLICLALIAALSIIGELTRRLH